ncbi:MAG: hypothetical protein ACYC4L_06640 [Chloroflexota bacterium]
MATAKHLWLVGKAGPVADGLLAILAATPGVSVSGRVDKLPGKNDPCLCPRPQAVLLECDALEREVPAAVHAVRLLWPEAKCLVLAGNVQQQNAAQDAGADVALVQGCPPAELIATVEALLC